MIEIRHSNHWKGGLRRRLTGYTMQYQPTHHFADVDGYVMEHRLVWERCNNAILLPYASVHHINDMKSDNRIENLEAMMKSKHTRIHNKKDLTDRLCSKCKRKTSIQKSKNPNHGEYERWYKDGKGDFLCNRCYYFWKK